MLVALLSDPSVRTWLYAVSVGVATPLIGTAIGFLFARRVGNWLLIILGCVLLLASLWVGYYGRPYFQTHHRILLSKKTHQDRRLTKCVVTKRTKTKVVQNCTTPVFETVQYGTVFKLRSGQWFSVVVGLFVGAVLAFLAPVVRSSVAFDRRYRQQRRRATRFPALTQTGSKRYFTVHLAAPLNRHRPK